MAPHRDHDGAQKDRAAAHGTASFQRRSSRSRRSLGQCQARRYSAGPRETPLGFRLGARPVLDKDENAAAASSTDPAALVGSRDQQLLMVADNPDNPDSPGSWAADVRAAAVK